MWPSGNVGSTGFKWYLPDGSLRLRYTVLESTNFAGVNIPVKFEWFVNLPESGKLLPLGNAKVTALHSSQKPEPLADPKLRSTFVDRTSSHKDIEIVAHQPAR